MRNYHNLKAFQLADELTIMIYRATKEVPKEEIFGLTSQLRRAAVSTTSNIVEGASRKSQIDFLRFIDIAYSSACEVEYQRSRAHRLNYLKQSNKQDLLQKASETAKGLNGLIKSLRPKP